MKTTRLCPRCRQPLPENAPEGLCPACLAKAALESEPTTTEATIHINPSDVANPGTRVPPDPGQLAPHFPQLEILELLGQGGMGMVYKARQARLDRFVALKILPVDSAAHPSFAERFNREARALAKLNHPGIVAVYEFGQTGRYYYFIMEYVDGVNLRRLLESHSVEPRQALELVVQICTALQYAHDEGVVHRDIKPENILLNKRGQVKIADFGLAKLLGVAPDTALTMSKEAMGTLNYMAPEQREDAQKVDHRADIYSLGVVFYEMLTGEVPMGRFEPPSKKVQVDVRLDEVVLRALEREPARRYQHVSEVKTNVEKITSTPVPMPGELPPKPVSPIGQRTFVKHVVIPMLIVSLLWLALLLLAPKFPFLRNYTFDAGAAVLTVGLPTAVFEWRRKLAGRGLRWKDLPPTARRRGALQIALAAIPCLALLVPGLMLGPSRTQEWREDYFYPSSRAYEKLDFSGYISGYQFPFWAEHSWGGSGTMAIKIYRKDSAPAALIVSLPGLHLQNTPSDPSQPPRALTFEVLTNWLHEGARLDTAQPQVAAEEREVMDLFEPYYEVAPGSWDEFGRQARGKLRDFDFGGSNVNMWEGGGVLLFIEMLPVYLGACLCLFYALALRILKKAFGQAHTEIEAGGRTLPKAAQPQSPTSPPPAQAQSGQQRFAYSDLYAAAGYILAILVAWLAGTFVPLLGLVLFLAILFAGVRQLASRLQIQQARERGLWPPIGTVATDEHVKRLAQAGETALAAKLYRQVRGVPRARAKAAVETLAATQTSPQPSTPPPSQTRLSKMALTGVACLLLFVSVLAYSLVFDLWTRPQNHRESVPSVTDARGRVLATQQIEVPGPSTSWRVAVLISAILGAAAAFCATGCGWLAVAQIRSSSGALYGLGLAVFDGLVLPLLLMDCLLISLAGPSPLAFAFMFISALLDYFIVRSVWRFCRHGRWQVAGCKMP